jgi:RND family efflux transporter MFP subunit
VGGLFAAAGVVGGWYFGWHHRASHAQELPRHSAATASDDRVALRVNVATPRKGGIEITTTQYGTVMAFESAHLFAYVTGYLGNQTVDIGSRVTKGEAIAEIEVPELKKGVDLARAAVDQARAGKAQAEARAKTAEAVVKSARAGIASAKAEVEKARSALNYREKARERIADLVRRRAVEKQLVDEEVERFESAVAAHHSALADEQKAEADLDEALAKVEQTRADLEAAKTNIAQAEAALGRAELLVDYARIVAPYTGVVTERNYFPGDFIRAASEGNSKPMLSVARTDKMRVVVQVPDAFVPYVNDGDPATIRIKPLGKRVFRGKVSRYAHSESVADRTMRTEIDLENPDQKLHEGMYGDVTIVLEPASANLSVPSSSLVSVNGEGEGELYVVKQGAAHRRKVRVGKDNGVETEILSGLSADDEVVVRYNGALSDGTPVHAEPVEVAKVEAASH